MPLADGDHPSGWVQSGDGPTTVLPSGPGTLQASVSVPSTGSYSVWLNGTILRKVSISIDGKRVGSVAESGSLYAPFGTVQLTGGTHSVTLRFGSSSLAPGTQATIYPLGPLALVPAGAPAAVERLEPAQATSLCGKSLDWIEVVRG